MLVLMITQKIDPDDPLLAFTIGWVRALAQRVERLDVLCLEQKPVDLPNNVFVWSMGKEHGRNRLRELARFYGVLAQRIGHVDAIFVHMIPRYAVLAAPLALLFRKPMILWYTHRQADRELRLALSICRDVITAVPDSFPVKSDKVRALGHGIDNAFFSPDPSVRPASPPLIVHVARLMPIKHQETLIRGLAEGIEAQAAIVGAVPPGQDNAYLHQLQTLAKSLGVADRLKFTGGLGAEAVRDLFRAATVAVNLSPPGLFDKAALESMLAGVPTIISNPAFDSLLGEYSGLLRIADPDDVEGLARSLKQLLAQSSDQRTAMAEGIRLRVVAQHSLDGLMDRLVALMSRAV